jgi:hypothetical protein
MIVHFAYIMVYIVAVYLRVLLCSMATFSSQSTLLESLNH